MTLRAEVAIEHSPGGPTASQPLPATIVYLDQCALSSIVKSKDAFWDRLHQQLTTLLASGRIACPFSVLHKEESLLTRNPKLRVALERLYHALSAGFEFRLPEEIERLQLQDALRAYLAQAEPPPVQREPTAENLRRFAQETASELQRRVSELLQTYRSSSGPASAIHPIHALVDEIRSRRPDAADPLALVESFLRSAWTSQVPFFDLSCRVDVLLGQQSRAEEARRRPKPSDRFDRLLLSHYAPYCDAVFLDNEFRKLASQRNLDLPNRYGVRLFSESNRDAFMDYLHHRVQDAG